MKKNNIYLSFFFIIYIFFSSAANTNAAIPVKEEILGNGLKILTVQDYNSSLVSVNVYVRTGSINESPTEEGISHFLEHLFFRGTADASGTEFKTALESLGGVSNAETSKDYTRYYINVPAENAQPALNMLIDALQNASFDENEIEQERKVVLEEYSLTQDNPARIFYDKLFEMAFPGHPYSKSPIGTEKNIKSFKRNSFLSYRERFYSPANLIFVITGNFDEKKAISTIKKAYSSVPNTTSAGPEKSFTPLKETSQQTIAKGYVSVLMMGFYAPAVTEYASIYSMDVTCFMLGMGDDAMLKKSITDTDKDIKNISVNFQTMKEIGLVTIAASYKGTAPAKTKEKIMAKISDVANGSFTDEDILRAKNMIKNSFIFGNETNDGKAESLGYYEAIDSYKFASSYLAKIDSVTKDDIIATAKSLAQGPCCVLSIIPQKRMADDDDE